MTNDRNAALGPVRDALNVVMDPLLTGHGFARRRNSLVYKRDIDQSQQVIDFSVRRVKSRDGVPAARAGANFSITMPGVNTIVSEMTRGNPIPILLSAPTVKGQIGLLGPKRGVQEWDIRSVESAAADLAPMAEFVREYVVPFFTEYTTAQSITEGYERKDVRVPHYYKGLLVIAGAYVHEKKTHEARRIVDEAFGQTDGLRREYSFTLGYLAKKRA